MKLTVAMSVTTCVLAFLYRDWWMAAAFAAFIIAAFVEERAAKKGPPPAVYVVHNHEPSNSRL